MRRVLLTLYPITVLLAALLAGCRGDGGGLKSENPDVRRERALELGRQKPWTAGGKKTLADSLTALGQSDPDPLVRSASLEALAEHDRDAARKLACGLLVDEDPTVRWDAVKVLSDSPTNEARAGLLYAVRTTRTRTSVARPPGAWDALTTTRSSRNSSACSTTPRWSSPPADPSNVFRASVLGRKWGGGRSGMRSDQAFRRRIRGRGSETGGPVTGKTRTHSGSFSEA